MKQTRKISVIVITYNHEKYLSQALNGILNQKIEAQIEIIIADDCSTDGTLTVACGYQSNYPSQIKILSTPRNLGHTRNYQRAWEAADGDYIAHCDGDDYWTSPEKLSKQLEFLESNPNYSCCGHKVWAISEEDGSKHGPVPRTEVDSFDTEALLEACFPHNCSLLFRNRIFTKFPDFFFALTGHDWCIDILNSLGGPIKIMPEVMGVWRMRTNGLWGGRKPSFHFEHNVFFLQEIKSLLPQSALPAQRKHLLKNYFLLSCAYFEEGKIVKANEMLRELKNLTALMTLPKRQFLSLWARIKYPSLYQSLRSLRNQMLGEPPTA
jgi:glycosyltransferase involved in cell wall biosynthesis